MTVISRSAASALDARLRTELWGRIEARLSNGDTLATERQFQSAIESAYHDFTGQMPPAELSVHLRRMIGAVNAERPDIFLAHGVQNAVRKAFASGIDSLRWDQVRVQRHGSASIRRFLRCARIRDFLLEIRLDPALVDVDACVRQGSAIAVSTRAAAPVAAAGASPSTMPPPAPRTPVDGHLGPDEAQSPFRAPQRLLSANGDESYLQMFEALQRIPGEYDGLLRTLIKHKELVIVGDEGDRTALMTELMRSPGLLDLAQAAMERRDPEYHLLSSRLPPYDQAPGKLEPMAKLTIEESFVDDLRGLSAAEYSQKPHSKGGAAADIHGLIHLLDRLIEATPFRRKVRLLLANRVLQGCGGEVDSIYRDSDSVADGRAKAEGLLREKLERILTDASDEEEAAVRRRSRALLMTVEQKQAADADAEADEIMNALRPAGEDAGEASTQVAQEEVELSEIETSRGAQLADIEVREDGRPKKISGVIMPDSDDSKRMVMAYRDAETGQLAPLRRKRRLRYVNRLPDGSWQALTG